MNGGPGNDISDSDEGDELLNVEHDVQASSRVAAKQDG